MWGGWNDVGVVGIIYGRSVLCLTSVIQRELLRPKNLLVQNCTDFPVVTRWVHEIPRDARNDVGGGRILLEEKLSSKKARLMRCCRVWRFPTNRAIHLRNILKAVPYFPTSSELLRNPPSPQGEGFLPCSSAFIL